MSRRLFAIALLPLLLLAAQPADAPSKSLLESDPAGWSDLLAGGLKNWKRVPIPAGGKLKDKDPWKLADDGRGIVCDGAGLHEMLLYDKEFADGTFHAEWRFRPVEGKKGYNGGVYVRNSADGKVWHQAQVGSQNVGYLFGETLGADGKLARFKTKAEGPQRGKPAGEWNVYEITGKGKELSLWVNGHVTSKWPDCPVAKGHVGLEAEGWVVEFRKLLFKAAK
jgi:hypothetical protein